jgi:Asp-tRNA(Asn)/Glu-tRNA(Gln) amidotransferase A subunit family amidase
MDDAVNLMTSAGAELSDVELPASFEAVLDAQWTILMFEFARALAWERLAHRDQLSERLRDLLDRGMACDYQDYAAALDLARRCRAEIAPLIERHDALLTPSAAGEAPVGLQAPSDLLFQRLWTVLHLPCVTLPGLVGEDGMPVGIQLVGRHGAEPRLLAVASWVEARLSGG